jgi:hypothetical protein
MVRMRGRGFWRVWAGADFYASESPGGNGCPWNLCDFRRLRGSADFLVRSPAKESRLYLAILITINV